MAESRKILMDINIKFVEWQSSLFVAQKLLQLIFLH